MAEAPQLVVNGLEVGYGRAASVVRDVSLTLGQGQEAVILGANGAGKSTLLLAIAGLLPSRAGRVTLNGEDISSASPHERVRLGLVLGLEGHRVVNELSVEDNLRLALYSLGGRWSRREVKERVERSLGRFEILGKYRKRMAGTMSGGEQQMLVMARLFITDASVLLVDEPSLGLSPLIIDRVYQMLRDARREGKTTVVVEQSANDVLQSSDSSFVLRNSRLERFDASASREDLARAYLG
ncbi:MAG: ATP-binding cassette domain-containing protein [Solirubrobacteraceae bacterium]